MEQKPGPTDKAMEGQDSTTATAPPTPPDPGIGTIINEWKLVEKLGVGVFGAVFKCKRADENNSDKGVYAMKIEKSTEEVKLLGLEIEVYDALQRNQFRRRHHPTMLTNGQWDNCRYIVMTLLGPSLQELKKARPDNKFRMGTALVIARQTLECLQQLHRAGYLHRDIKPGNFAIGCGADSGVVYALDFGMARKFVKEDRGQILLRRPRLGRIGFRGTLKYASTHAHRGTELCRADDIESWFYLVCELIKGKLPWNKFDDSLRIYQMKMMAKKQPAAQPNEGGPAVEQHQHEKTPRRLLLGGCPRQFGPMLDLIAQLKYYDPPPYEKLSAYIEEAIQATGAKVAPLDWQRQQGECSGLEATKSCIEPAKKQEPAPAKKQEPAPAKKQEPAPAKKQEPAPVKKQEPAPAKKQEPAPAKKQEPSVADK